jgi:hypothetical protein
MTERLLQFIWQFQYFNKQSLQTVNGDTVDIIFQGNYNTHQGPDFLQAKIKINQLVLVGNIEIHLLASDFIKHGHATDKNYQNLILHIVYKNDLAEHNQLLQQIPTIVLEDRIATLLLDRYNTLMNVNQQLPCYNFLPALPTLAWLKWKETLAVERLTEKSNKVLSIFEANKHHWEETFWQLLAYNFGLKLNADLFFEMATTININILAKHKHQLQQIEAILLGQANLLENNFQDGYAQLLQKEFRFLQSKYQFKKVNQQSLFLRTRPANFPTIRLAQLAALIQQSTHLFSTVKECSSIKEIKKLFQVTASDYWNEHFLFDKLAKNQRKKLGNTMIENIIINAVIPVVFAYGLFTKNESYTTKAVDWLQQLKAEHNTTIHVFENAGITNKTALDAQALLQLKNKYCTQKRCLQCAVGNYLLKATN